MTRSTEMLEAIRSRQIELKRELQELQSMEAKILNEISGVKPGDKVRRTHGAMKDSIFVVSHVEYIRSSRDCKPWVSGFAIKKDGSPGLQLKHLYSEWERIEDGVSSER